MNNIQTTTYQGEELEYQTYYSKYDHTNRIALLGYYNTDNTQVEFIQTETGWKYSDPMDGHNYLATNWTELIQYT